MFYTRLTNCSINELIDYTHVHVCLTRAIPTYIYTHRNYVNQVLSFTAKLTTLSLGKTYWIRVLLLAQLLVFPASTGQQTVFFGWKCVRLSNTRWLQEIDDVIIILFIIVFYQAKPQLLSISRSNISFIERNSLNTLALIATSSDEVAYRVLNSLLVFSERG